MVNRGHIKMLTATNVVVTKPARAAVQNIPTERCFFYQKVGVGGCLTEPY